MVAIGSWVFTRASPVKEGELKFLSQCTIGAGVTQGEGVMAQPAHAAISSAAALDGRGGSGVEYVRRAGAIHRSVRVGRIRLAAQDAALSRRRSRVRIPYALPRESPSISEGFFVGLNSVIAPSPCESGTFASRYFRSLLSRKERDACREQTERGGRHHEPV